MSLNSENMQIPRKAATESRDSDAPLGVVETRIRHIGLVVLGALILLTVWEVSVTWLRVPGYILPAPQQVFRTLWAGVAVAPSDPAGFYIPLFSTMQNAFLGYLVGVFAGIVLGSIMAEFRPIETMAMPYIFALQSLPKVAIAPLIIIWCGFGEGSKVAMAALMTFFPMMVNTFTGLRATEIDRLDLMRALSASRLEVYRFVKLPSAAPYIFAGLNMGIVYALLGTLIAEFLGSQQGVGVVILQAQAVTDTAGVFAILVLLAAIGMVLHWSVGCLERRIIHWRRSS
jgi:NitT/TauT family transport system permease protein